VKTVNCYAVFDLKGGLKVFYGKNCEFWEVQMDDQVKVNEWSKRTITALMPH
jgi:hypothetical protein